MKKAERMARARSRERQRKVHEHQERAVAEFVAECRVAMSPARFEHWFRDADATAGEAFHIFEGMVSGLRIDQTHIHPRLRKAIDEVLEAYEIDREAYRELCELNVGPYWNQRYHES